MGTLPFNGNNIFMTSDWQTNENILLIIQNAGQEGPIQLWLLLLTSSGPGVWSRQLLLMEAKEVGSMEGVIQDAISRRWAVVVLNPNLNTSPFFVSLQASLPLLVPSFSPSLSRQGLCQSLDSGK